MRISSRLIIAATIMVQVVSAVPASELDPDPAINADHDTESGGSGHMEALTQLNDPNITSQRLQELAATGIPAQAIVERWLDLDQTSSGTDHAFAKKALRFWSSQPASLCNERSLFLRLLRQTNFSVGKKDSYFGEIIASLSPPALSVSVDDDTTALELSLSLRNQLSVSILLAEKSSPEDREKARRSSLNKLSPQVWARFFLKHNMDLLTEFNDFQSFCQSFLAEHPERELFEDAIVLSRLFASRTHTEEELRHILEGIDIRRLLSNGGSLSLHSETFWMDDAIWHLGIYCNQLDDACGKLFIDHVALSISDPFTATRLYKELMGFISSNHSDADLLFLVAVSRKLTVMFAEHSPARLIFVLQSCLAGELVDLSYLLAQIMENGKIVRRPSKMPFAECIVNAIKICSAFSDDRQHRTLTSVILAFTLRSILTNRDHYYLAHQLSEVHDEQLRVAFALTSALCGDSFMQAMKNQNSALYDRFSRLLPESPPPASLNVDAIESQPHIRNVERLDEEYELLNALGQGASGTVFRARCLRNGYQREVAIKVIDSSSLKSIEIEFMWLLCHKGRIPGLVPFLDVFEHNGKTYLVMELVNGCTLMDWEVPASIPDAAVAVRGIIFQLASVLKSIQSMGWMHGDLSHLNNVMVDPSSNCLFLIDFGHAHRKSCQCGHEGDFKAFYARCVEFLDLIKHRLQIPWYDHLPGALAQIEKAVANWMYRPLGFDSILADPVFDDVRDQYPAPAWDTNRYLQFPDLEALVPERDSGSVPSQPTSSESVPSDALIIYPSSPSVMCSPRCEEPADHVQNSNVSTTSELDPSESIRMQSSGPSYLHVFYYLGPTLIAIVVSVLLYLHFTRHRRSALLKTITPLSDAIHSV